MDKEKEDSRAKYIGLMFYYKKKYEGLMWWKFKERHIVNEKWVLVSQLFQIECDNKKVKNG